MLGQYIKALEIRARWLRWAESEGVGVWRQFDRGAKAMHPEHNGEATSFEAALPVYKESLQTGDTFFMNKNFCQMVDNARSTIPDDLKFELSWMQADRGWLWMENSFTCPAPEKLQGELGDKSIVPTISAIGWIKVRRPNTGEPGIHFMTFQDFNDFRDNTVQAFNVRTTITLKAIEGFGCWSYFTIYEGETCGERITKFEKIANQGLGVYADTKESNMLHEVRWIYGAFHLMAQKMAHYSDHQVDRHTRKRAIRENRPVTPFIRVVSLRRLELDREREKAGEKVDWQWQWQVHGHWRNQFYSAEGIHRQIYIDAYVKGPENKPLKPVQATLFVARR